MLFVIVVLWVLLVLINVLKDRFYLSMLFVLLLGLVIVLNDFWLLNLVELDVVGFWVVMLFLSLGGLVGLVVRVMLEMRVVVSLVVVIVRCLCMSGSYFIVFCCFGCFFIVFFCVWGEIFCVVVCESG